VREREIRAQSDGLGERAIDLGKGVVHRCFRRGEGGRPREAGDRICRASLLVRNQAAHMQGRGMAWFQGEKTGAKRIRLG
jgi:hypothetical protein